VVLLGGEPLERGRADDLQPEGTAERDHRPEREHREEQANSPVRQLRAHR
jgi:hypothetical protein